MITSLLRLLGADAHDSKKIISSNEIKRKAEVSTTRDFFNIGTVNFVLR